MITRNGVCYDLKISPHRTTVDGITYVFSSQLHLDKFKSKIKENRETINKSLSNRFNIKVNVDTLADAVLYKKIETRGFLVFSSDGVELCQRNITYKGATLTN